MSGVVGRFGECAGVLLLWMTWKRVLWGRYVCRELDGGAVSFELRVGMVAWRTYGASNRTVPLTA